MRRTPIIVLVLIALVAGMAGARLFPPHETQRANVDSAYERVMRTGTLRCAYISWAPYFVKDPNTGQFEGIYYDLVEEMGKRLGLKIDWVEEVGTATMFEGYKTGRYDAVCAFLTSTPSRARESDFTIPFAYTAYNVYVRANDTRFDKDRSKLDDPSVRAVSIDGEYSAILAAQDFPHATQVSLASMTDGAQLLMYLESGKADVASDDPAIAAQYMAAHPGVIKPLPGPPARTLPIIIPLPKGEYDLKAMLDVAIQNLIQTGFVARTFAKHEGPETYLLTAPPYQAVNQ